MEFDKKCETLDQCKSDLVLSVEMDLIGDGPDVKINRSSVILVGERDTLAVILAFLLLLYIVAQLGRTIS